MNETKQKILEKMQENLDKKIEIMRQEAREKINNDKQKVEKAIEMISKRLVYKREKNSFGGDRYVLATEEMFYGDYLKEPEHSWNRGIKFHTTEDGRTFHGIFSVNNENYYDMRYLLNNYADDVKRKVTIFTDQRDRLRKMQEEYERLVNMWPNIKKMIEDWNALQEENNFEE